jgi:hypothetical protein
VRWRKQGLGDGIFFFQCLTRPGEEDKKQCVAEKKESEMDGGEY